jgi:hypothetical protein
VRPARSRSSSFEAEIPRLAAQVVDLWFSLLGVISLEIVPVVYVQRSTTVGPGVRLIHDPDFIVAFSVGRAVRQRPTAESDQSEDQGQRQKSFEKWSNSVGHFFFSLSLYLKATP